MTTTPKNREVGFGILGAGMIADYHRQAIAANADPRGIQPTGHIGIFRDFIRALREDRPFYLDADLMR